jgi:hypothetical protein
MRVNANKQANPSPVWTKRDWAATKTRGRGGHRGRKEAAHSWKRREREGKRKGKRKERRTPGSGKKESEERLRKQTTLHLSKRDVGSVRCNLSST